MTREDLAAIYAYLRTQQAGGQPRQQVSRRPVRYAAMFDYLTGIYNITPTPFLPDGALDEASLRRLTAFTRGTRRQRHDHSRRARRGRQADRSRARSRDRDRHRDAPARTFRSASAPRTPAPTAASPTAGARRNLGRAAVMVAPPKLARTNDAALERHYLAVAEAIDIPVVVQDFPPAVGGITMSVELIARARRGVAAAAVPQARRRAVADEGEPDPRGQPRTSRSSAAWAA